MDNERLKKLAGILTEEKVEIFTGDNPKDNLADLKRAGFKTYGVKGSLNNHWIVVDKKDIRSIQRKLGELGPDDIRPHK